MTRNTVRSLAGAFALALVASGCDSDNDLTGVNPSDRVYTQIERLGNPLTSEVFFPKRDHGLHNNKGPVDDPKTMAAGGTDVPGHVRAFVASFNRSTTIGNTLATVLSPDMLLVFPNRATASAGWLTWALANGYGGRKLSDDVVDAGLMAVFGTLLDPNAGTVAGLTSDNVAANDKAFLTTFPYLAAPTP